MERFLQQCAKYIYSKHPTELQDICVVFPNRRSGVFFTSYLQKEISNAVIGPQTTTVGELISDYSDLLTGEKLQLISILYDVFRKHTETTESFEEFYFWGEILLADFNDVDRYLVNAKDLFTNVSDIKEIESVFDYLTEEQKSVLARFWGSIAVTDKKEFQKKHERIWAKLYGIYVEFKSVLKEKKLGFGGMIDRGVAESLKEGKHNFPFKKYYIVGLNALNACEKSFFAHLQRMNKAQFLWDYDVSYFNDKKNEAGLFLRKNLREFPPPPDFALNIKILDQQKNIKLVAVSSTFGQAQQIPNFLDETKEFYRPEFDNTAIVLADESLLFSALGAIPPTQESVNVTMGYSVKNSVVYGFLMLLVNLLKNKRLEKEEIVIYHRYVTDILNHQLLGNIESEKSKALIDEIKYRNRVTVFAKEIDYSDIHKQIFALPVNIEEYCDYFLRILGKLYHQLSSSESEHKMLLELLYTIYSSIEKLRLVIFSVLESQQREITETVFFRLFTQYLGQVSVAFEGEPLSGMQVMGILETRCLDFENLIILGLNENKWPRTFTAPSFIPHGIRLGFGLPGIDEQDAMYGYYFYRLLQRAKNVTATYSVVKEGIGAGELSRYGYQLKYDSVHGPELVNLDFSFANEPIKQIEVESTPEISEALLSRNSKDKPLSPSAINTYLQCSLRFYYRYVEQLPEPEELKEEIDGVIFGNIFHDTLENLYQPFVGKVMNKSDFETIRNNKAIIENEIRKQIAKHYLREKEPFNKAVELKGASILIYENIKTYLYRLLKVDESQAPFTLKSLENKYFTSLKINDSVGSRNIYVGGKIDRVDVLDGILRVIDYKTGHVKTYSFKEISELFEKDKKDPKKEILQALIYSWILSENTDESIQAGIYSLTKLYDQSFDPNIKWNGKDFKIQELKEDFVEELSGFISGIYSPKNVFKQTTHLEKCKYCPYNKICQRY